MPTNPYVSLREQRRRARFASLTETGAYIMCVIATIGITFAFVGYLVNHSPLS